MHGRCREDLGSKWSRLGGKECDCRPFEMNERATWNWPMKPITPQTRAEPTACELRAQQTAASRWPPRATKALVAKGPDRDSSSACEGTSSLCAREPVPCQGQGMHGAASPEPCLSAGSMHGNIQAMLTGTMPWRGSRSHWAKLSRGNGWLTQRLPARTPPPCQAPHGAAPLGGAPTQGSGLVQTWTRSCTLPSAA